MEVVHPKQNSTILICRLSHIGDCILTMPLACAIRAQRPDLRIVWAVDPPGEQLLWDHPCVDEVVSLPRGWRRSATGVWRARGLLRRTSAEIALDPQSLTKSALVAWLSRSPIRIGLASPSGRELAPYLNTINVPTTDPHLVDRTLDLLPALGLTRGEIRFGMRADEVIDRATRRFLGESHLGQGYAVINPGGGWESKRWVPRRYGEVARELGHAFQIPSLVTWSGDEELAWGREIVATSGGFAMLSPKTNLRELRSFLRSATLFVGSDTGPMHLAASVGTPCVVLYGPTTAAASGPLGPRHVAIQAMVQSGRGRKRAANTALLAIDTGMVIAGCQSILQSGELRPSPFQGSCHV